MNKQTAENARRLHENSIVIDLHIDPIIQHFLFGYNLATAHDRTWKPRKRRWLFNFFWLTAKFKKLHSPFFNHIDIPRMRKGGYTCGAFGIHAWPRQSEKSWQRIKAQLTYFHDLVKNDPRIILAKKPEDIRCAFDQNKLAAFPGVEGAHTLGRGGKETEQKRLARIEDLSNRFNVAYLTLAHFSKNDAASPCLGFGANKREGLTHFGKALIEKMNEMGMIADLAHVNNQGILDGCHISKKPVIISHAGLASINPHPRNISADALRAVAKTGGLVGVIFATNFLSYARQTPTSEIVLRHINGIVQQVGEDHVAIGTDFDGWIPGIPRDMNDAGDLPLITQGMLDMGYSKKRIKKILGENFLRVWDDVLSTI